LENPPYEAMENFVNVCWKRIERCIPARPTPHSNTMVALSRLPRVGIYLRRNC
jgi:hypothetical protein